MSQVAATCGTCCVVQSRQEKRSRKEKEEEAEEEKKKEDVRRVRRSEREKDMEREREGGGGGGGNHSNVSLYILRFVLLAGYANFRPHRYPSRTKVPSPLYTRSPPLALSLSLSPSLALSVAIESEKFAKVRSRDAGVGVVGSVIKICASKQT